MSNAAVQTIEQGQEVAAPITPPAMLQLAIEKGASMEQLEKLMDLQQRWEENEARKAYVAALNAFKADPPTVRKNKSASFGSGKTAYDYADLAQVANLIAPALSAHGLSHSWQTSQHEGTVTVTCTLTHVLGHREQVTLSAPSDTSGSKNAIQAIASTVSYLERYTLLAITGLAVEGMDTDAKSDPVITEDQRDELVGLFQKFKDPDGESRKFCEWMKIAGVKDLLTKDFARGKRAIENNLKAERGQ